MPVFEQRNAMTTDPGEPGDRIAVLEAKIAELTARLDAPSTERSGDGATAGPPATGTRRHLLKLAAGAAAGGTALAVAKAAGPVAAADGDPINVGEVTTQGDSGRVTTVVDYVNPDGPKVPSFVAGVPPKDANIMLVRDRSPGPVVVLQPNASAYPAAVAGYANQAVTTGVYGRCTIDGFGVVGWGSAAGGIGVLARGERANVEMFPDGAAPPTRADAHTVGEVVCDGDGRLWYCVASGSPGVWRELAGESTAGAFHAVTPFRVYDSRFTEADRLSGGDDYTVSVADARDVDDYDVTTPDAVPAGTTAVSANVVAIKTTGNGFATVNPGGDGSVGAAALNWTSGQTIGNAGIFKVSASRELEVLVRNFTTIDLTIDITGYWL